MKLEELRERMLWLWSKLRCTFTLEAGRGETYQTSEPTLYAHDEYESSSVLAGQPRRRFVHRWNDNDWEQARKDLAQINIPYEELSGSSYIPSSILCQHLPGDDDLG